MPSRDDAFESRCQHSGAAVYPYKYPQPHPLSVPRRPARTQQPMDGHHRRHHRRNIFPRPFRHQQPMDGHLRRKIFWLRLTVK